MSQKLSSKVALVVLVFLATLILHTGNAVAAIDVDLIPLTTPSVSDIAASLPAGLTSVQPGDNIYLEIWIKNNDGSSNGITGGYLDISFDSSIVSGTELSIANHGNVYTTLSDGTVNNATGLVNDFGGNASAGVIDKGDDEWVRLGYVEFAANSVGTAAFTVAAGIDKFARATEGAIAWVDVELNNPLTTLSIYDPHDPSIYIAPALESLTSGTFSGLTDAYTTLKNGMNDSNVNTDPALRFWHAVARIGMLVVDRSNVLEGVDTSVLEILELFGVTVSGDSFDTMEVSLPLDPSNTDCLLFPDTANVAKALAAINNPIRPEIDEIIIALVGIPSPLKIKLDPSVTGLQQVLEIDEGDKLALIALLKGIKAGLFGLANPGHNLVIELENPLFTNWQCGMLPDTTTINAVLTEYVNLLKVTNEDNLDLSKGHLLDALDAFFTAKDYILAENHQDDPQDDDLLSLDPDDSGLTNLFTELGKLKDALTNNTAATFNLGRTDTYDLKKGDTVVGSMTLHYDFFGEGDGERVTFTDIDVHTVGQYNIDWFEIYGDKFEASVSNSSVSVFGHLEGTVAGTSITDITFDYDGMQSGLVQNLSAQRTGPSQDDTLVMNPNPVFDGVAPRDMLPQFDQSSEPIPGTFGHGLPVQDDATLGGTFPDATQADWMPQGFEVWGGNVTLDTTLFGWEQAFYNIDQQAGYTKLGESNGPTLNVTGQYDYYVIAARGRFLLDAIAGSDNAFYSGNLVTGDTDNWENITGDSDSKYATVGYNEMLPGLQDGKFTGFVGITNPGAGTDPGTWTDLTVITDSTVDVSVSASSPVVADGSAGSTVTITITNEDGTPAENVSASSISVSVPGTNIEEPLAETSAPGVFTQTVSSETVQIATVTVKAFGQTKTESVTFTTGPASKLAFTGQPEGPYSAGQIINAVPQVSVWDAQDRLVAASNTSITMAVNPSTALSGTTVLQSNQEGKATFDDLSINQAGAYTLTATGGGLTSASSQSFIVIAGNASLLEFLSPPPTEVAATESFGFAVTLKDTYGNRLLNQTPVTLTLSGGPGVLSGITAVNTVNGVATFTDLAISLGGSYQLTAQAGDLGANTNLSVTAEPALKVSKTGPIAPVNAGDNVIYTIAYGNTGLAAASNVTITEVLPAGLTFKSASPDIQPVNGVLIWNIGTILAQTPDAGTVTFTATVSEDLNDGGKITNANLTIDSDEPPAAVTAATVETIVNDKEAPVFAMLKPLAGKEGVARDSIVQLSLTDRSGIDPDTVVIKVAGDVVYRGKTAILSGTKATYSSAALTQSVKGICTRTVASNTYTYTFKLASGVKYDYEQKVAIEVTASDKAEPGNTQTYDDPDSHFITELRTFGSNAKVSDSGTLAQDNPATVVDSSGAIWVVWDQATDVAGDTDIYIGKLGSGATRFSPGQAVYSGPGKQSHPVIASDSTNKLYVAWQGGDPTDLNGHTDIFVSTSADGSAWSDPVVVNTGDSKNASDQTVPSIAVNPNSDTVYLVFEDDSFGNQNICLATSSGGTSWTETPITTNTASQTDPRVFVDVNNDTIYIIWADARNASTDIYGTASSEVGWANIPLITGSMDEYAPVGVAADDVHLLWINQLSESNSHIFYTDDSGDVTPFVGNSIVDDADTLVSDPSVARGTFSGRTKIFAAWTDSRDLDNNSDTDIYYAESGSPFGTNILINTDSGTAAQSKPIIRVNKKGQPYVVWVDERNGNKDIYYAGTMSVNNPLPTATPVRNAANTGHVVRVKDSDPNYVAHLEVEVPDNAMPEGVDVDEVTMAPVDNLPEMSGASGDQIGLSYDFGPSGLEFTTPVTIRIPFTPTAENAGFNVFRVYWYNTDSQNWIEIETVRGPFTDGDGTYLEADVSHFTTFSATGTTASSSGGGGGGCVLSPNGGGNPVEYFLPFGVCMVIMMAYRYREYRRRRCVK